MIQTFDSFQVKVFRINDWFVRRNKRPDENNIHQGKEAHEAHLQGKGRHPTEKMKWTRSEVWISIFGDGVGLIGIRFWFDRTPVKLN
jgi:hypothetical protein